MPLRVCLSVLLVFGTLLSLSGATRSKEAPFPRPSMQEAIACAADAGIIRGGLVTSEGKKLRGYLQVTEGGIAYRKTKSAEAVIYAAGDLEDISYDGGKDPYSKQADRLIKKGDWSGAADALAQAPSEVKREPAVALKILRVDLAKSTLDKLRSKLTAKPENARNPRFLEALDEWLRVSEQKSLDQAIVAGLELAWHEQVLDMDEPTRAAWLAKAKKFRIKLTYDTEAPAKLEAGRTAFKAKDYATALTQLEAAHQGHARLTDEDRIALATCYLEKGKKREAADFLKGLPLSLREREDVDALLSKAGVPKFSGTFGFRGNGTGIFADTQPPTSWSSSDVKWSLDMPSKSNSSPCVVGDKVFTCAEPNVLYCVDSRTGKVIWKRENSFAKVTGASGRDDNYPKTDWMEFYGYTSPTPASNGKVVVAVFGIGLAVAYDMDGNKLWHREFVGHSKLAGISASPIMIGDWVICPLRKDGTYCIEAATGKTIWTGGETGGDSSLCPVSIGGKAHLLSGRGKVLSLKNGSELFSGLKTDGNQRNWGPTPVADQDIAVFHWHLKNASMCNTTMNGWHLTGPNAGKKAWEFHPSKDGNIRERMGRSPVAYQGIVYAVTDNGKLDALDIKTGKLHYTQNIAKGGYVCLSVAGGNIWHMSKSTAVVFKPGPKYEEVASFNHGFEAHIGSPAFVGTRVYFRGKKKLWCIGK